MNAQVPGIAATQTRPGPMKMTTEEALSLIHI